MTQPRRPADSALEATHLVLPQDTNAHNTAFGGRIMEWMDIAAGIVAMRHSGGPVVTVAVDQLSFERPIQLGDVVMVRAAANHAGTTSMEVGVRVEREIPQTGVREHCLSGYFTFVAVDREGRPQPVRPLTPVTAEEKRRFDDATRRRERRLASRRR